MLKGRRFLHWLHGKIELMKFLKTILAHGCIRIEAKCLFFHFLIPID